MLNRSLVIGMVGAALALASCSATGAPTRVLQSSVQRDGGKWIVAGRVHGDTAAHATARDLVVELCGADGRVLASARTRAELERRDSPRVARGWDGSFRIALPAGEGGEPTSVRVR